MVQWLRLCAPNAGDMGSMPGQGTNVLHAACVCVCVCVRHSVVFDSLRPHGLQPTRLLCPRNSQGKNTGVGSHSLFQGIFSTPG